MKEDIKNNCFTHYINKSLFEHLIMLEYSHMLLTEQYHAILIIDDIIFTVWYKAQMQFSVNSSLWFNMIITIIVLKSFCKIEWSLTFLNINEIDIRVNASQFKQNEIEVIIAIKLVKIYIEVEIFIKNIIILMKYTAQVQLLKRSLVSDLKVQNVEAYIIDSFQDKEASVIILCMMRSENLTSCFNSIVFWLSVIMLATRLLYYVTMMNFSMITLAIYIWYDMFKICSRSTKSMKNTLVNKNSLISWKQSINFKSKSHNETKTKLDTRAKIKQQTSQKSKSIIRMWMKLLQQISQKSKSIIEMQAKIKQQILQKSRHCKKINLIKRQYSLIDKHVSQKTTFFFKV